MKFKTVSCLLLPVLLSLSGCHNSKSTTNNANPLKEASKPQTNYKFNDDELSKLLNERQEMIAQTKLTFSNKDYKIKYATKGEDEIIMVLEDQLSKQLTLLLPLEPASDSLCQMENGPNYYYFDCSDSQFSKNGEVITLNGKYLGSKQGSPLAGTDFTLEYTPYIAMIGTTKLAVIKGNNNKATITTSSPLASNQELQQDSSDLGVTTYLQLKDAINSLAGYDITLVFDSEIDGSSDDDINMYTGLMIRDNKLDTQITANGSVFSGGTDLFSAGVNRILVRKDPNVAIEKNQQIGVHSWASDDIKGNEVEATSIPYTHTSHRKQATYFKKMLNQHGVDFYLYTIKAAPAKGEHFVTKAEMDKYNLVTKYE